MIIQTKRLVLRPWKETDAEDLYTYAKDPAVGPIAGWPVHTSVENCREIIRTVLSAPETYALIDKQTGKAIGSIGLLVGAASNIGLPENEGEIGYWLGVPYWGQGLVPEAVRALLRHGFEDLNLQTIWCGYFEGNEKSKRVQEKCGFIYQCTRENIVWELMHDVRTEHITCLSKQAWQERRTTAVLYAHGKGGSAAESEHYKALFPDCTVEGIDYRGNTPWEAGEEIRAAVEAVYYDNQDIILIANSIGAYFAMHAHIEAYIQKAFFISPVVDMEALIGELMRAAQLSEAQLKEQGTIPTDFGEDLSWEYLCFVRNHPLRWQVPTAILYGEEDTLTCEKAIKSFAAETGASLSVMQGGEHWFHTPEQMQFLDNWIQERR